MIKKVIDGSTSRLTIVDHEETYGRHILKNIAKKLKMETMEEIYADSK